MNPRRGGAGRGGNPLIRTVLITATLLAAAFTTLPLAAAKPDLPTDGLVGYCTSQTQAGCEGLVCVGFSRQVPVCVDLVAPNGGPEPTCMPVYREYDFGAVRYVSRDSCHAEIYVNGEQVWPPTAEPAAVDKCVLLVYVADYQWTYLCVEPKDTSCAVYIKHVSGVTERRDCLVGVPAASPADAGTCVPTSGGLDYKSYACVDPKNAGCAVYTLSSTDSGVQKRCYGVLAPSCLDIYWSHEVGPVKIESRNSCHRQVYVFDEPVLP